MAIYIKGVDMPMEGFVLSLDIFPDGTVADHCTCTIKGAQAAAVPPHGDLIDRDALIRACKDEKGAYFGYESAIVGSAAENAAVIIPAEREGET